jgi:hypothetical protein
MYVGNNSYVFNKGTLVYVTGAMEMNGANSTFYLRNSGQLLQATTGTSGNKGLGKLSVFQEGSVNNFAYNYWCSPVGTASVATGNEDFGITMLSVPTSKTASSAATVLSTANYNGVSDLGTLSISPSWIFRFLSSSTYSEWVGSYANTNISAGQGFTMKGTGGSDATDVGETAVNNPGSKQRYDFRGKPNDGNITINVANGKLTLTGNPYPSAIDLSAFLTDATNCTGIAYFWEQDKTTNTHFLSNYKGGYGTYSPVSRGGTGIYVPAKFYAYDGSGTQLEIASTPNNNYPRYFAPVGQGFMIEGNASGSTVTMKNSYRVFQQENASTSVFERQMAQIAKDRSAFLPPIMSVSGFDYTTVRTTEVPQIRLNTMMNNEAVKQVVVAFDSTSTDGVDRAKDAKNMFDTTPMDMYLLVDDSEYTISVLPFDIDKRIPIGFRSTTETTVRITVADIINFSGTEEVYLHDKLSGDYYDIKNQAYEFQISGGVNNHQYEITFRAESLSNLSFENNQLHVFQNNQTHILSVLNPNLENVNTIVVYDIIGKEIAILEHLTAKNSYSISTESFSDGVYIAKIIKDDGTYLSRKVSIYKAK